MVVGTYSTVSDLASFLSTLCAIHIYLLNYFLLT